MILGSNTRPGQSKLTNNVFVQLEAVYSQGWGIIFVMKGVHLGAGHKRSSSCWKLHLNSESHKHGDTLEAVAREAIPIAPPAHERVVEGFYIHGKTKPDQENPGQVKSSGEFEKSVTLRIGLYGKPFSLNRLF